MAQRKSKTYKGVRDFNVRASVPDGPVTATAVVTVTIKMSVYECADSPWTTTVGAWHSMRESVNPTYNHRQVWRKYIQVGEGMPQQERIADEATKAVNELIGEVRAKCPVEIEE